MYGHPFLLKNLPPTDPTLMADYLPYLNLLRELLREHADQIQPHPITISIKPGDLVLLRDLLSSPLGLQWTSPHLVILTTPTAVKLNRIPQWQHLLRNRHLESSREHFTVVLLANAHPNACVLALLFLIFLPCIILHVAIANQKFNQLYLQGYQPLQNHPEDCYEGPHQDTGP
jgi:hypothetical protein